MIIRKDPARLPQSFPFLICRYSLEPAADQADVFHYHDFCEITCIERGTGAYYVNGRAYHVSAGDIVIFNQEEPHGWCVEKGTMDVLVLEFAPKLLSQITNHFSEELFKPFSQRGSEFQNLISRQVSHAGQIRVIMLNIRQEAESSETGCRHMICADILKILILLIRHYEKSAGSAGSDLTEKKKKIRRLEKALDYINENFTSPLTLRQVSDIACMSPNYFSTYFREVTGQTFSDYVTGLRLDRARNLIASSEKTMVEIAMSCGFQNMSNFYRLYKKHIGPV